MRNLWVEFLVLLVVESAGADVWVRDFSPWGNVILRLNSYREAGVSALWLAPPFKGVRGKESYGFDVYDYSDLGDKFQRQSLETRYGTRDELKKLIETAHSLGLRVYLTLPAERMGFVSSISYPNFSREDFFFYSYFPSFHYPVLNFSIDRVRRKFGKLVLKSSRYLRCDGWVVFSSPYQKPFLKEVFSDDGFEFIDFKFADEVLSFRVLNFARRLLAKHNPVRVLNLFSGDKFVCLSDFRGKSSYFHRALFLFSLAFSKNVILDGDDVVSFWGRFLMKFRHIGEDFFIRFFDRDTLVVEFENLIVVLSSSDKRRTVEFPSFITDGVKRLMLEKFADADVAVGRGEIENTISITVDWKGVSFFVGGESCEDFNDSGGGV